MDGIDQLYESLPVVIRAEITREQFRYMTDDQRNNLLEEITCPDLDAID